MVEFSGVLGSEGDFEMGFSLGGENGEDDEQRERDLGVN